MTIVRTLSLIFFSMFLTTTALSGSGGSAYSIFGIGDVRYIAGTRNAAMGYTGIGLSSPNHINLNAPGTWSKINRVRLEAEFMYEGFNSSDGAKSLYRANGDFAGGVLAIPISTVEGIVFVGGFTPYSNVDYSTFTRGTQLGVDYSINHVGSGGVSRGFAGFSYAPALDFSIGASLDYLFGTIRNERIFTPSPSSTSLSGSTTTEEATLNGITFSLGGLYSGFGNISEPLRPLSLGFSLSSRGHLTGTRQSLYDYSTEHDTSEITTSAVIPIAVGLGLSYQASERYVVAADFFQQNWFNSEFNGSPSPALKNSYRLGIGVEKSGNRDYTAPWLDRVAYRLGFSYLATYYKINGEAINEWAITGGVGLPFSGDSRLNIALAYGQRGTTGGNLIKDSIIRCIVSLSITEQWFVRYEEE